MPKATIKSSSGAVITIEGNQEEVAEILSLYERAGRGGDNKPSTPSRKAASKRQGRGESATDLVTTLRESGFFDKPKSLGDISKALEESGYLYPLTTLSGVVLGLIKKGILHRKKEGGRWVYGK
jgi:hypothetical protein